MANIRGNSDRLFLGGFKTTADGDCNHEIKNKKTLAPWKKCYDQLQFSSVTQSCPTLCDPMNRSMPGLPIHHQLPEFAQTHVHRVASSVVPSPPAPNPSQHQGFFPMSHLFAWGGQSTGVSASASVFPMNTQDWYLGSILKSRRYFGNKSPSSQSHSFFNSHVWMWVLDYKEGWELKN